MITAKYLRRLFYAASLKADSAVMEFYDTGTVVLLEVEGREFRIYVPDEGTPSVAIGYIETVYLVPERQPDFSNYTHGSTISAIIEEWNPHDYS